jgi:hypothetical protein
VHAPKVAYNQNGCNFGEINYFLIKVLFSTNDEIKGFERCHDT